MDLEQLEKQRALLGLPSYVEQLKRQQAGESTVTPLEVLGALTRPIESVTAAPARAAVAKLQQSAPLSEVVQAFKAQMGKPPETAPSGEQLAEATGLTGGKAKAAGLGLEMAIDPTNLIGAGVAKAAVPLLGLAGALAKTEKLAEKAQDIAKAAKAADLPMDAASRLRRAEEMGFDTSKAWYHGSGKNFSEFKVSSGETGSKKNPGVFLTDDPFIAEEYAGGEVESLLKQNEPLLRKQDKTTGGVYVTHLKTKNPKLYDVEGRRWSSIPMEKMIDEAKSNGHDSVIFKNIKDGKFTDFTSNVAYVFEPDQIRSVNAAFDPSKAKSGVITAGGAIAVPALVERMRQQEREKAVGR
jgi:ADP-Ribosyltransferase in polyvalent proteins